MTFVPESEYEGSRRPSPDPPLSEGTDDEPATILVVDDEPYARQLLTDLLEAQGFRVVSVARGEETFSWIGVVDLVLLDAMLPGRDGWSICRELKERYDPLLPVIMVTARTAPEDVVRTFEAGADDYVAKPAEPMVLLARVRALLRRVDNQQMAETAPGDIVLGRLRISEASHRVWLDGEEMSLTTQEFELLLVLARAAGTILSREELFKRVRGIDYDGLDRSIDGRISKLRKKLGDDAVAPKRIRTVWGKGYLLVPDAW